jgi:hypothetical protein
MPEIEIAAPQDLPVMFAASPRQGQVATLEPQIHDLYGVMSVLVRYEDGQQMRIPASLLSDLSSFAGSMAQDLTVTVDTKRREFIGDVVERFGLVAGTRGQFLRPGADQDADGTPFIRWVPAARRPGVRGLDAGAPAEPGWGLFIQGVNNVRVALAAWDDPSAVESLVESMADLETLMVMAAITHPKEIADLSSRMTARTLRSARSLPGIDLKKVRTILDAAGLSSAERVAASYYGSGRMRLLNLKNGDRNVPVAVAIQAPGRYTEVALTAEEDALPRIERQDLLDARHEAAALQWLAAAKNALAAGGWRAVDLPEPSRGWYYYSSQKTPVLWVTRFDAEKWSLVEAGARVGAPNLAMNRGASI